MASSPLDRVLTFWDEVREPLAELLFDWQKPVHPVVFVARILVLLLMVRWWWQGWVTPLATPYQSPFPLGHANLIFHEAGHMIFGFLGKFLGTLGGTLGQLLVPLLCFGAFLFQEQNPFNGAFASWWLGQNLLDIAPYMNDARSRELLLLGGVTGKEFDGYHDWEYLLGAMGLLRWDTWLAGWCYSIGLLVMFGSIVWASWLLSRMAYRLEW